MLLLVSCELSLWLAPPKENPCDDIHEKIFKNHALKSIDAVRAKPEEAILSMERKPEIGKSIPSFPTSSSRSDVEMVSVKVLRWFEEALARCETPRYRPRANRSSLPVKLRSFAAMFGSHEGQSDFVSRESCSTALPLTEWVL